DLIAGTHGRGVWILDDIEPLRQFESIHDQARLLSPAPAWRFRWNKNTDTPLPPDEPAGQNPPEGAIIDYYLPPAPTAFVALDILDSTGNVVRHYSSTDPSVPPADSDSVPGYWIRPPQKLGTGAGMHRFVWDLH